MIGAHAGIQYDYKKISKTIGKCLICGEYSECQITRFVKSTHVFYIKIRILEERYIFDWKKCNHRAELYDKESVTRYKEEQEKTGFFSIPNYQNMKLNVMMMPKKPTTLQIVLAALVAIAVVAFGIMLGILLDKLGIPIVP